MRVTVLAPLFAEAVMAKRLFCTGVELVVVTVRVTVPPGETVLLGVKLQAIPVGRIDGQARVAEGAKPFTDVSEIAKLAELPGVMGCVAGEAAME